MSKVLILAAGRRRYVVEAMRASMGPGDSLMVSDRGRWMPGLSLEGVNVVTEPSQSEEFRDWLLGTCAREGINGVLSLHDYQTLEVSSMRDELRSIGTRWIGPGPQTAAAMLDKVQLASFLGKRDAHLAVPTYAKGDRLPEGGGAWVVKDRFGSGSSGLLVGASREFAHQALGSDHVVVQPMVEGQEWNLDFFVWGDGNIRGHSAKRKLRMRGGETDAAHVFPADELPFDIGPVLGAFRAIDHLGNIDMDIILSDEGPRVVDVNPRFGGGYAFSVKAGYRAAEAVWEIVRQEAPKPFVVKAQHGYKGAKSLEVVAIDSASVGGNFTSPR